MKKFGFLFITQEDPFYVRIFFEEFLAKYPRREEIRGVVIAPTMGKKTLAQLARQMYGFYGARDFLRVGLRYAYYRLRDALSRRLPARRFFSITQICRHYGVPVIEADDINDEAFLERVRALGPDLIVSVAAPQIFRPPLIAIPARGCINIHNSKLPQYRGMLPNFWQMFQGEKSVGTTIHRINRKLDDGEILLQRETPIHPDESLHSLIVRTKRFGAALMVEAVEGIREGRLQPLPNPAGEATYFTFPSPGDVRQFRRRGYRLL